MERIGLIDMGSNTVRLVIYEIDRPKETAKKGAKGAKGASKATKGIPQFTRIFDTKATLGLGAAIKDGVLEDEALDAAVEALKRHKETAHLLGAKQVKVFATAFVRKLANSSEVRGMLEETVDMPITILSGDEEAHLGFIGATSAHPITEGTVIDLGGGSCELTAVRGGKDVSRVSIDMGCVTAFAKYVRVVLPTPAEVARIQAGFEEATEGIDLSLYKSSDIVGIGGSARFAAAMLVQLFDEPTPETYTEDDLDRLLAIQEGDPHRFSHQLVLCDSSRMHSAVPGIAILQKLMQLLEATQLRVSYRGLREGFLIERVLAS